MTVYVRPCTRATGRTVLRNLRRVAGVDSIALHFDVLEGIISHPRVEMNDSIAGVCARSCARAFVELDSAIGGSGGTGLYVYRRRTAATSSGLLAVSVDDQITGANLKDGAGAIV